MKKRNGFTIVELVIVIAIIAIMETVIVPSFKSVLNNYHHTTDQTRLLALNRILVLERMPASRVKAIELSSTDLRFMYHENTAFLALASEETVVDSYNGNLNGKNISDVESLVELSELDDDYYIGGAIYIDRSSSGSESSGGSSSGGTTNPGGEESGNPGTTTPGGETKPGETNPGGGSGGTTDPQGPGGGESGTPGGTTDPQEPDRGETEPKEWWEELEEITVLPEKNSDEYNELQNKSELRLSDTIKEIPDGYFNNNTVLEKIYFGDLEKIGTKAFRNCSNLQVALGTAKTIGERAFYYCEKLQSFDFGKTTGIGAQSFASCMEIKSIEALQLKDMYDSSFANMGLEKLTIRACKISVDEETYNTEATPSFKDLNELEIRGGEFLDIFCAYVIKIIERANINGSYDNSGRAKYNLRKIVVRDIQSVEQGKIILPFKAIGPDVELEMDQQSYDILYSEGKLNNDPFNGRTKENGITIIE